MVSILQFCTVLWLLLKVYIARTRYFEQFDDFFPERDRRAMYILGATADADDIEDLVWIMQQLKDMEVKQHQFIPRCCRGNNEHFTEPEWFQEQKRKTGNDPTQKYRKFGDFMRLDAPNIVRETDLTAAGSTHQSVDAVIADPGMDAATGGHFRRSVTLRESRLEAWMRARHKEEERERRKKRRIRDRLHAYCARTFCSTRARAFLSATGVAVSVWVTVFSLVHIASFYNRQVDASGNACEMKLWGVDDNVIYGYILLSFWCLILIVVPIVLLWVEYFGPCDDRRVRQLRARARSSQAGLRLTNVVNFVSRVVTRDSSAGHSPLHARTDADDSGDDDQVRHNSASAVRDASARGRYAHVARVADMSDSDDDYDDGGIDNPNWHAHATRTVDHRTVVSDSDDDYDDGGIDNPNWQTELSRRRPG
eukprot:COSAG02_NODE_12662_length_1513_cov_1.027581_1_plen_423_part_00